MDLGARASIRRATQQTRQPPAPAVGVVAAYDAAGCLPQEVPAGPLELTLEPTGPDGEFAEWLDDAWWTEAFKRFADVRVTLRFAPTPDALLHPVLLYQLEMVRRVAPGWRIVGTAYLSDITADEAMTMIARGPYDEVRFIDSPRPGGSDADHQRCCLKIEELFARIRREQGRSGTRRPVVVRIAAQDEPVTGDR